MGPPGRQLWDHPVRPRPRPLLPRASASLADHERILGPDHANTLYARSNLAKGYESAGRNGDAIALFEQSVADSARILGPDNRDALKMHNYLAHAHESAGRHDNAITLYEKVLADFDRVFGPGHPDTLT